MTMPPVVTPDQRQGREAACREIVRDVEHGMTVTQARRRCSVSMHRSTVYRLLKRVEREGEDALVERRHGHSIKRRGEVLAFVLDYCQGRASAASCEVQPQFHRSRSVFPWQRVQQCASASCSPCCFWEQSGFRGRGTCAALPPMVWRCSPDACAPMAIATPKPLYHSSLVPMERSASQMPSPPGPPTSGIRPRTQEEPNTPPRLLAILMDIINSCTVKSSSREG